MLGREIKREFLKVMDFVDPNERDHGGGKGKS
jgi:hypothetical protein